MIRYDMGDTTHQFSFSYTQRNPEIKQAFILSGLGDYLCDSRYFTQRDGLKEFLVIYTLQGKGWIRYGKSDTCLLPDTIVIINCENYQYYKTDCEEGWHFLWIHFSSDYANGLVDFINQPGIFALKYDRKSFMLDFEYLKSLIGSASSDAETQISLTLHKLIASMVSEKSANRIDSFCNIKARLDAVIVYIRQNYHRKITVDRLVEVSHISKFYLIRLFKELTGTTPYRYIMLIRVDEAKKLLRHTRLSVKEVGEQTGFCDTKNFITNFKKFTGLTPLQFRKNCII